MRSTIDNCKIVEKLVLTAKIFDTILVVIWAGFTGLCASSIRGFIGKVPSV